MYNIVTFIDDKKLGFITADKRYIVYLKQGILKGSCKKCVVIYWSLPISNM